MEIEKEDVIQDETFGDEQFGTENYECWLQDSQFDRRNCLVIVPRSNLISFVCKARIINLQGWTSVLLDRLENSDDPTGARDELLKICSLAAGQ